MPAFRPSSVRIHPDVENDYAAIERRARGGSKSEATLWRAFLRCVENIRRDGQWGEVIPRIPAYFLRRYGAPNLYCVDLPAFHRAFYTIFGRDVIFLDLVGHRQYDKWTRAR